MQSTAATSPPPEILPTRERLLEAAARVCAERGLHGATTREIAEAAHVNEVTLFRHFGSKAKLIAALFQRTVEAQVAALDGEATESHDLRTDLTRYARRFDEMLFENEGLIRTIMSEGRQYPDQARQMIHGSGRALRERLETYLLQAQKAGTVRCDLHLAPTIDAFTGMLLAGMLRRTGKCGSEFDYEHDDFLTAAVELFVRGIAAVPTAAAAKLGRRRS